MCAVSCERIAIDDQPGSAIVWHDVPRHHDCCLPAVFLDRGDARRDRDQSALMAEWQDTAKRVACGPLRQIRRLRRSIVAIGALIFWRIGELRKALAEEKRLGDKRD